MQRSLMRCLLLSSLVYFSTGCLPAWKKMPPVTADASILQKFKPAFTVALYNTRVDIIGNHLSGLLLLKKMPDSSLRLVFSNEVGYKFFDFEFDKSGNFKVYSVIKQLNKRSVLKTLQKDFELILMDHLEPSRIATRSFNGHLYFVVPQTTGYHYYITDSKGTELIRLERASKTKTVVEAIMKNYIHGIPDTIGISHKNFDFTIGLKRIER